MWSVKGTLEAFSGPRTGSVGTQVLAGTLALLWHQEGGEV